MFTILAVLLLATPAISQAEDSTWFGRKGDAYEPKQPAFTFTSFVGGYADGKNQDLVTTTDHFNETWHFGLRFGWAFTPYTEAETSLGYTQTKSVAGGTQDVYLWQANGIGQYPVAGHQVVPYVTLGFGGITYDDDALNAVDSDFAINYGAGVKIFIFKNLAMAPDIRGVTSFDGPDTAIVGTFNLIYYADWGKPGAGAPSVSKASTAEQPPMEGAKGPAQGIVETTPTLAPAAAAGAGAAAAAGTGAIPEPVIKKGPPYKYDYDEFEGPIGGIEFALGSDIISEKSYDVLRRAAAVFKKYDQLQVRIEGHSDSTGSLATNMKLSSNRAESVRQFLVHEGVSPDRLNIMGIGPHRPIASNQTSTGRAVNRRIEFRYLNPDVLRSR